MYSRGSLPKVVRQSGSALFTLLTVLLVLLAYGSVGNRWYRVITVDGNSMAPTLRLGDLMIVTPPPAEIAANSIVVLNVDGGLVTHRLLGYDAAGRPITQGDANDTPDQWSNPNIRIVGLYRARVPGLGYPLLWLARLLRPA
jgi:signal peptidase